MKKKILIFDLDGVLIDSKENMFLSWKQVQEKHNLKQIKFYDYFKNIGRPFNDILKILGIKKNYVEIKKTYDNESILKINKIKYFSNTIKTLKTLKKKKYILNIVTSKDIYRTKKFLKHNIKLFNFIECAGKDKKGKPNPYKINKIVKSLNVKKSECVYIGDMHVDYITAKNAKIDFIYADWGYGKKFNYKYKCNTIDDLLFLIN